MKLLIPLLACSFLPANLTAAEWQSLSFDAAFAAWKQPTGAWFVTATPTLDAEKSRFRQENKGVGNTAVSGPIGKEPALISNAEFGDCEIHIEFMIGQKSNSGVFLMGSYEVQIYDSFGVDKDQYPGIECGGLYPQWIDNANRNGHSPSPRHRARHL